MEPYTKWEGHLPMLNLTDLWQVSLSLIYTRVKSAALRNNHLFTLHRIYWTPHKLAEFSKKRPEMQKMQSKKCQ